MFSLMKKILISIIFISIVGAGAIRATTAFFSDTETSANNILQAGIIDLLVDNTSYYNGELNEGTTWEQDNLDETHLFFNFDDLKPDDWGEDTISLHVNDNESWACMNVTMTANDDNGLTEPEQVDGDITDGEDQGELAQNLNFVFWVDDGDNVLEDNEEQSNILKTGNASEIMDGTSWTLADSTINKFGENLGRGLLPDTTYYIGKAWCFGTLGLAPVPQGLGVNPTVNPGITCDGSLLDNTTQSDIVNADVQFEVVQHRNNPDFSCAPPVVISCETEDVQYANSFSNVAQGTRKNLSPVLPARSNAGAATGGPQTTGTAYDANTTETNFFSLGFTGGNAVWGFAQPFYQNATGPDLQTFEVTGGSVSSPYPDEGIKVEVATTPVGPWVATTPATGLRDAGFEMPITSAQYVKITEASNIAPFEATADGYDLDAIQTFCRAETS